MNDIKLYIEKCKEIISSSHDNHMLNYFHRRNQDQNDFDNILQDEMQKLDSKGHVDENK